MSKSSDFLAFTNSLSEGSKEGPVKKMLHKNAIGLLRTFTGPFSGLVEPLVDAGFDMKIGKQMHSVTRSEYRLAKQMADKGFVIVVRFKDEDGLQFFKNTKDLSAYAKRQELKVEWVGNLKTIEVR